MAKKGLEKSANVAKIAKTPSNKYRNNRKNDKCNNIKDFNRKKKWPRRASKSLQMSQKSQK